MASRTIVRRFAGHRVSRAPFVGPSAVVVIAALLSSAPSGSSSAPQAGQDLLTSNIDRTVSPRDDFFQYANGEWLGRNPIPDDRARWGIGNLVSDAVYAELRRLSESAAASKAPRGSAAQLIGDVWATGMDAVTINAHGLRHLQPDLNRIDGIRSLGEFIEVVATLHRRRMLADNYFTRQRVLFDGGVEEDEGDSDRWIFSLSQGGLSIGRLAYAGNEPPRTRVQAALREYLVRTFVRLHYDATRARASADAVYALEARLASAIEPDNASRRMELAELSRLTPLIDWKRYFRRLGAAELQTVTIRQARFFQVLSGLLGDAPLEDWKDYLRFWLIKTNAPFLDDGTFGEFFAFKSVMTGQRVPPPRWKRVVWQERYWLGLPLEILYGDAYWPAAVLARYQSVGESIRQAFQERIERADWLDDSTKAQALRKLSRLTLAIGPPKTSVDFSTMPLRRDSYVLNMMRSAEWFHEVEIRRLDTAVDETAADLHPTAGGGDAEYIDTRNEVRLTSPMIAPGWRVEDLDDAFVYGATALGHEIAHGFDNGGRLYDAEGNKVDWWRSRDAAVFAERAQSLVDQYNAFMPLEGLHVDGRRSLRENLATLVGLRLTLDAFKRTEQFRRNERVGGFTPLQRFFLAFAYSRASHESADALATRLRSGSPYAPDRERVNGVVRNLPEFYEAFDIRPGDRMYLPESARVTVW
jgi:putative endopeptidase